MSFDAANAVLSGKPDDNQLRTPVSLKIAATDLGGLTTSTIVDLAPKEMTSSSAPVPTNISGAKVAMMYSTVAPGTTY
jgi:hypothetical protein